jgi:hypothetical protein
MPRLYLTISYEVTSRMCVRKIRVESRQRLALKMSMEGQKRSEYWDIRLVEARSYTALQPEDGMGARNLAIWRRKSNTYIVCH